MTQFTNIQPTTTDNLGQFRPRLPVSGKLILIT